MVSATTYTLVGVVNKFLTVLLNVIVWDKHSSGFGIFAVCVCLLAGTFYQQAPKRDLKHKSEVKEIDLEKVKLNGDIIKEQSNPLLGAEDDEK